MKLIQYCLDYIECQIVKFESLIPFAKQVELLLVNELRVDDTLCKKYYDKLTRSILGSILYFVTMQDCENKASFLAQLPLQWIEKVICCDALFVENEFERYQLVKRIMDLRHAGTVDLPLNNVFEDPEHDTLVDEDEVEVDIEQLESINPKVALKNVTNSIFSYIDGLLPMRKKRKYDEDDDMYKTEEKKDKDKIEHLEIREKTIELQKAKESCMLPKTLSNIYHHGIVYTYMTFPQLGVVKNDDLVPFNLALESYWLQAELGSRTAQHEKLPPFRFGYKFQNLSNGTDTMVSEAFNCAGILFRILLVEDNDSFKVLLQKSVGKVDSISYSIYIYDHRTPFTRNVMKNCLVPITKCLISEDGYCNPIPIHYKETRKDDVYVVVLIRF
jgi:hypothetical protein